MIFGGAVARLEITNIEYLQLISEKAESHGDERIWERNTVSCKCICVRGFRMRLLLCVYVVKNRDGKYESFSDYINFVQLIVFFMLGSLFSL